MRSFLFCTSYIDNGRHDQQALRYKKWLDYYVAIAEELGVENIFMIDDGSIEPMAVDPALVDFISVEQGLPDMLLKKVNLVRFNHHLGRTGNDYTGWWRSFTYSCVIAKKYAFEKFVHIESDFYVISPKLRGYIRALREGWTALYSAYYQFPETAIQVICKDCFDLLEGIYVRAKASDYILHDIAEHVLPFTHVAKDFVGDRLGESAVLKYWMPAMKVVEPDYVGQLPAQEDLNNLLALLRAAG